MPPSGLLYISRKKHGEKAEALTFEGIKPPGFEGIWSVLICATLRSSKPRLEREVLGGNTQDTDTAGRAGSQTGATTRACCRRSSPGVCHRSGKLCPFSPGIYVEKVLCCGYPALLADVPEIWSLMQRCAGRLDKGCEDTCLHFLSHRLSFLWH